MAAPVSDSRVDALVARLYAVTTESEAFAFAEEAERDGLAALDRWTGVGPLSEQPRANIQAKIDALVIERRGYRVISPTFPVELARPEVFPEWKRLADRILDLYLQIWSNEASFPERSFWGDVAGAGGGLAGDLGDKLGNELLGKLLVPIGIALALVVGIVVFSRLGGGKAA